MKIMKINSYYKEHYDAIPFLAKYNIELNVITNESPFVLAQTSPNIVIHPKSNMMNGEYPTIKFLGPNCSFPNYNYIPEFGFNKSGYTKNKHKIKSECSFVNTTNNLKFIKKLESMFHLRIWGLPVDSLGYMGRLNCSTYEIYNNSDFCAADNEQEILKANYSGKICYTPFDYLNNRLRLVQNIFNQTNDVRLFIDSEEFFESKDWRTIFNKIFTICEESII